MIFSAHQNKHNAAMGDNEVEPCIVGWQSRVDTVSDLDTPSDTVHCHCIGHCVV